MTIRLSAYLFNYTYRQIFFRRFGQNSSKKIKDKQKIRKNLGALYEKTFFGFFSIIWKENILITPIIIINKIRVILVFKVNNSIYKIKKVKQIFIYWKNEKHAFIIILLDFYKSEVLSSQNK